MLPLSHNVRADNYQELLLFPTLNLESTHDPGSSINNDDKFDLEAAADLFFVLNYDKTRFLAEVQAATEEIELERAQMGWEAMPGHRLWLGRFHTPLGYWNTQYNHSSFLQTSIHRPSIVKYEDNDGILPMHVAGAMIEGELPLGVSLLEYTFVYGAGASLGNNGLASTRLTDISEKGLETNLFGRLVYRPDELINSQIGIFGAYSEIAEKNVDSHVDQSVVGGFLNKNWIHTRLIASIFYLHNNFQDNQPVRSDYLVAGYLHGEYELSSNFITYLRYEDSYNADDNRYLSYFPNFAIRRAVLGLRYDILNAHSLSLEISGDQLSDTNQIHTSLQWSAVFP
jgi:hypothetical protein